MVYNGKSHWEGWWLGLPLFQEIPIFPYYEDQHLEFFPWPPVFPQRLPEERLGQHRVPRCHRGRRERRLPRARGGGAVWRAGDSAHGSLCGWDIRYEVFTRAGWSICWIQFFHFPIWIGNVFYHPLIDELIFFRGVAQPPTSKDMEVSYVMGVPKSQDGLWMFVRENRKHN